MAGFIEKHSVWSDEQKKLAADLASRIRGANLRLIRLAWADPHGASRAKAVTVPVFLEALRNGYNINVATTTLDSAGGRVFASFTQGGGMGLAEMTGSPNLCIVPDPATFRVLPWTPGVGWILCDEYFNSGVPFHFSPRQLLKKLLRELHGRGHALRIGLEVEWYLARVAEESLGDEHVGVPGLRGRPILTSPAEPGYSYHSETNMDLMQPVLGALAETYEALGLPLRSIENEWGPGQVECTFSAQDALRSADDLFLFRTATRQVCRRMGHFATFMARPALKGYYASGWHLHQSLVDAKTGENRFMPAAGKEPLSELGRHYLGGLLANAVAATVFATPTVNGYRRFKPNSLAPDRAGWAYDHRGTMVRALGGADDPATRLENRLGEPAANPYLFIASQVVSGLDGIERKLDPGPQDVDAYAAKRTMLPTKLTEALDALSKDVLFRKQLGDTFVDYYLKLKGNEALRFGQFLEQNRLQGMPDEPTAWEQNEYFDFFRPLHDWDALVQADRAHRLLYTDPAVFQEEMSKVFGAVWVYLGHESQIPNNDDFIATKLGLRPVILLRDSAGRLRALYNRCTHRGSTVCRAASGSAKAFQCPYHGWTFHNSGRLAGVPWPDGYACDFKDDKFNLAQVPRVESYRGFIFGTLNLDMPPLKEYLGEAARPLDEWIDRHPGGRIAVCGANRLKYRGNWKLAYDNSCDGYHVVFSHRSLLEMENRDEKDPNKGMSYYKSKPDDAPMYCRCYGRGHHLKDKRPNVEKRDGALWKIESAHPGKERYEAKLRARLGKDADRWLDLASSEPINLTIFPNLLILGNHIQVLEPVSVAETNTVWYGTAIVNGPDIPPGVTEEINALRLRTQEGFPAFGEVDDLTNFEEIQKGLAAQEDEWVYMHRGMDIPGRITTDERGIVTGPATDEVFMRLYIHHWKELMKASPVLSVKRSP